MKRLFFVLASSGFTGFHVCRGYSVSLEGAPETGTEAEGVARVAGNSDYSARYPELRNRAER
jgi:hypothetical protein